MTQAVGDLHLTVGKYRLQYRIADWPRENRRSLYQAKAVGQNRSAPTRKHRSALHVACGFVVVESAC